MIYNELELDQVELELEREEKNKISHKSVANRLMDIKLRYKILLLLGPAILFWFFVILNWIVSSAVIEHYNLTNDIAVAFLASLILNPFLLALPIYIVVHKSKQSVPHILFIAVIGVSFFVTMIVFMSLTWVGFGVLTQVLSGWFTLNRRVYVATTATSFQIGVVVMFLLYYTATVVYFITDAIRRIKIISNPTELDLNEQDGIYK
ncbi:MAG: hypothetical protein FWE13_01565 [Firmicutes bacterium]|nr:hypothetical protein [Bacillota bacterium]